MVVISRRAINQFIEKNPQSAEPLLRWYLLCKEHDWRDFSELKKSFGATDSGGRGLYIFNIGGNKYPLIARVIFGTRTIFIKFIVTHAEYDKIRLSDL